MANGLCHCCWGSNKLITLNKKGSNRCETCYEKEVSRCTST